MSRAAWMILWASMLVGGVACDAAEGDKTEDDDDDGERRRRKKKKRKKAASDDDGDGVAEPGCSSDVDCKGDRVCEAGSCKTPAPAPRAAPAPPKPTWARRDPNVSQPSSRSRVKPQPLAKAFSVVTSSVWQPRLGPKMKAGSSVIKVYEGPFGPSSRSLFAVTERPDQSYWVYVMGDDDKPWPAGPLHEVGTYRAKRIKKVAFFDADADGDNDVLVMAFYTGRDGSLKNANALMKWTPRGLRRMFDLEKKIRYSDSLSYIKSKLGVSDHGGDDADAIVPSSSRKRSKSKHKNGCRRENQWCVISGMGGICADYSGILQCITPTGPMTHHDGCKTTSHQCRCPGGKQGVCKTGPKKSGLYCRDCWAGSWD